MSEDERLADDAGSVANRHSPRSLSRWTLRVNTDNIMDQDGLTNPG